MTRPEAESEHTRLLGAELRKHRLAHGMSLRALARRMGLSGHATLVDYEYGRRLPPKDLLVVWENVLEVRDGSLRDLHARALAARADRETMVLLADNGSAARSSSAPVDHAEISSAAPAPKARRRALGISLLMVILLALLGGTAAIKLMSRNEAISRSSGSVPVSASRSRMRMSFENGVDRWWVLYGSQVAQIEVTSSVTYESNNAMLVRVTGASASKGYSAVGISHDVSSLRPGMKVTLELWVPGPQEAGVSFFVHDSHGKNHWAVENQSGGDQETEMPLPSHGGWSTFTWTVPAVDVVTTIGMQIWSENSNAVIIGIDAVRW